MEPEVQAASRDHLKAWCPRPTEDVCRAYGHIFKLLKDPRARRQRAPGAPVEAKQKMNVSVSLPQLPRAAPDDEEIGADQLDQCMPLRDSKMSADFGQASTGVSTTAGSKWRSSSEASASSWTHSAMSSKNVVLPALKAPTGPSTDIAWRSGPGRDPTGRTAAGINALGGKGLRLLKETH